MISTMVQQWFIMRSTVYIYIYIARDLDIQIYGVDTNFDCLFVELNSFLLSTATDD